MLPELDRHRLDFPPVEQALREPNGLLAWGGDLSPQRLKLAYRHGIFPWFSEREPPLWWSPDPRAVITPDSLHVPRRLARRLRTQPFRITTDTVFDQVLRACADGSSLNRPQGTWITPDLQEAYRQLHEQGLAHSVEVWQEEGLVGGLYGVCLGRVFFGESMFSWETDASKAALISLAHWLFAHGFGLIDCQIVNPHTRQFGCTEWSRRDFLAALSACDLPCPVNFRQTDISAWQTVPRPAF